MEKLTVEQALEALLEHTKVIEETETVPLLQACGRVWAKDMIAGFDNPPFDRSTVDGYACKAEDITDASESHPVQLTVLEEIDDSGLPKYDPFVTELVRRRSNSERL